MTAGLSDPDRLQPPHVLLGLLQERTERLGHIGESKFHGFGEPFPVSLELTLLEAEVSCESVPAGRSVDLRDRRGGGAPEEGDLLCQQLGVLEFLSEMHLELLDGAQELGPCHRGDMADVLDDRLLLGPQIPVEGFNEALYLHTGTPFSFADDG